MNILFICDPNSIHDLRWIEFFSEKSQYACYALVRHCHFQRFEQSDKKKLTGLKVLASISDHSTIMPFKNFSEIIKIRRIIRQYDIHILHIMYAEPNALWSRWQKFFKVPVLITTRGTDILKTIPEFRLKNTTLSKLVYNQYVRAFRSATAITCTSGLQMQIISEMGIREGVHLVRTGVDFNTIRHACSDIASGFHLKKPIVLMPRSMRPIYYHEFTLGAIKLLPAAVRQNYEFVFVNSDSKDYAYFQKIKSEAITIDADIKFLPTLSHEDLISLFKQSSLVVMNPISDGSPVTAMEAMACKVRLVLPPLNYDTLFQFAGAQFKRWSPDALAEKINEILNAPLGESQKILDHLYERVITHANSAIEMAKVESLYNRLHGAQK